MFLNVGVVTNLVFEGGSPYIAAKINEARKLLHTGLEQVFGVQYVVKSDCSKIKNTLGWKPEYTFETMMDEMIDFWLKEYSNE